MGWLRVRGLVGGGGLTLLLLLDRNAGVSVLVEDVRGSDELAGDGIKGLMMEALRGRRPRSFFVRICRGCVWIGHGFSNHFQLICCREDAACKRRSMPRPSKTVV